MSTFDYSALGAKADAIVDRFGGSVLIRQFSSSGDAFDPVRTSNDTQAVAAIVAYGNNEIDGTLVQAGDRRAIIKAGGLGVQPEPGNHIIRGGESWRIERVDRVDVDGGGVILWDAQLRRA